MDNVMAAHRVSMAARVVSIWSPWWGRYLAQADFAYGSYPGKRITGLSSMIFIVDNAYIASASLMDVAVSLEFALQQSARNMDARAETMHRKHPGVSMDSIGLAQALEINSDIEDKFDQLDPARWRLLLSRNIDRDYQESFDTNTPPALAEGSWTSGTMGFPHGLRAEKYLDLIIQQDEERESDYLENSAENAGEDSASSRDPESGDISDQVEDGDSTGDSHPQQPSPDNVSGQDTSAGGVENTPSVPSNATESQDGGNTPGEDSVPADGNLKGNTGRESTPEDGDKVDNGEGEGNSPSAPPQSTNSENTSGDLGSPSSLGSDENQQVNAFHDGSDKDSAEPSPEVVKDAPSVPSNATESQDGGNTPDAQSSATAGNLGANSSALGMGGTPPQSSTEADAPGNGEIGEGSADSSSGDTREQDNGDHTPQGHEDIVGTEQDTSTNDGDRDAQNNPGTPYSRGFQSTSDIARKEANDVGAHQMTVPNKPEGVELTGADQYSREDVLKELAEDINDFASKMPSGAPSAGNDFIQFSGRKLKKPSNTWKNALPRMLNPIMTRGQMSGQSDMSYAKQNPNQTDDLPIMMGFLSYPPEVTILIDSSYSMVHQKEKVISQFVGVMKTFFMRYAQPITVAIGDSNIQYAETSMTPYRRIMREVGKTHKGSSITFGETIATTAKKGAKLKSRFFPKPDILIILTDCAFEWPWMDRGSPPSSCGTIVVISTEPYEKASSVLPKWVRNRRNFVYIE